MGWIPEILAALITLPASPPNLAILSHIFWRNVKRKQTLKQTCFFSDLSKKKDALATAPTL